MVILSFFIFFINFCSIEKSLPLLVVFLGLAGFYFYGTRQFALSALACIFISSLFFEKGRHRIYVLVFLGAATFIILNFKDQLFGQYVEMTSEQLKYGVEDIRLLSANFYLTEYWPSKFARLIGNGMAYGPSMYGKEITNINLYLHFYRSDVGIIGAFNQFGLLYIINILWVNIKGLAGKFFTHETKYIRLFFLNALILILISEYYSDPTVIPFYCFILYLTDKSFEEKKHMNKTSGNINIGSHL